MRRRDVVFGASALAGCAMSPTQATPPLHGRPIVIAHRGASGERPEHTMAAYRLAIQQGADFIEPDLVMTRDGVLVCRHENEISETTDVAQRPEFAGRRREQRVDNTTATGWWVEDFTLAELKTLRCKERLPQLRPANQAYDGREEIPTFAEVLALAQASGVGVYPELKHPSFLRAAGLDPVPAFVQAVQAGGGQAAADIMFVQCFEIWPLVQLAQMSSLRWRCVQLMESYRGLWDRPNSLSADLRSDAGLADIALYAAGIGVPKGLIIQEQENGSSAQTDLIARAHAAGLLVHVWTLRAENHFLPPRWRRGDPATSDYMRQHGDFDAELRAFYAAGVDGVFSDFPAAAIAARG
ncbi:MAG: glycerophosphodiester phosphodiesterase [Hyphomonadaceae bacterium]|nr:glycerophosphodiester phosphodiesterase [Hyphomonadaceae bacterium]